MSTRFPLALLALVLGLPAHAFEVERVSLDGDGGQIARDSVDGAISGNGRFIAFTTEASLVPEDTNAFADVYLRDRETGELTLVSRSAGSLPANGPSRHPRIGFEGDFVVFASEASNLVKDDLAGKTDIFLYDRDDDALVRISRGFDGTEADGGSSSPGISGLGRIIVFESRATNLVDGDTNGVQDVFIYDVIGRAIRRVSVTSAGEELSTDSYSPTVSERGLNVAFATLAPEINPRGERFLFDVFVHDLATGGTSPIARPPGTDLEQDSFRRPHLSGDGEWIVFLRVGGSGSGSADLFLQELETGQSVLVTKPIGERQPGLPGIGGVTYAGGYVFFDSIAGNLVPGDLNGEKDVFRYSRNADETIRVSGPGPNAGGNGESVALPPSDFGELAFFASRADNLVPGDTNGARDLFLADLSEFRIDVNVTGSWYDVTQDGHGFIVEYLSGDRLLFYWFTFTPDGGREWIFGVLDVQDAAAEGQAFRQVGDGARFPPAIEPSEITSEPWGTIRFEFDDCDSGTVSWDADPPYPDGSMNLTRLTSLAGWECH